MRTSNPAFREKVYAGLGTSSTEPMTVRGTIDRSFLLLFLLVVSATWTWTLAADGEMATVQSLIYVGLFGGLVTAAITIFKQTAAPITAPIYAVMEGLVLGAVSSLLERSYPGIAIQAVGLTFAVLLTMLVIYRTGLIKVTKRLRIGVAAATGGVALFYLVTMVVGFFGVDVPILTSGSPIGIVLSLVVVAIAAMNLLLDFDFIEKGAAAGAPRYMEWYGAFGLLVTLVWLYLELLRLLARAQRR